MRYKIILFLLSFMTIFGCDSNVDNENVYIFDKKNFEENITIYASKTFAHDKICLAMSVFFLKEYQEAMKNNIKLKPSANDYNLNNIIIGGGLPKGKPTKFTLENDELYFLDLDQKTKIKNNKIIIRAHDIVDQNSNKIEEYIFLVTYEEEKVILIDKDESTNITCKFPFKKTK